MSLLSQNENSSSRAIPDIVMGSFWPVFSVSAFCEQYRIPATINDAMITDAVFLAISRVKVQLPFSEVDGETLSSVVNSKVADVANRLFIRAVSCEAKAELMAESPTFFRKSEGESAAQTSAETEAKYRQLAVDAVRQLCAQPRYFVEMI